MKGSDHAFEYLSAAGTRNHLLIAIPRLVAFAAVACLAIQTCLAETDAYTNGVSSHILRAGAFAATGDWDKVIAECDEAIRLNPNAIDAYRGRGAAYFKKEDWNNAVSNYIQVIRLNPSDENAYSYLGYAYNRLGNYDNAIENYDKYLDLNPNAPAEHSGRGFAYGKKGEVDKAISDYDEVIKLDPTDEEAYLERGYEYGFKKDFDKAADDYIKCGELDASNSRVWDLLNSLCLWRLATNPDASIRNGAKSLEIAKKVCESSMWGDWRFLDTLAAAYAEIGDFKNAVKYQNMAANLNQSPKLQEQFGLVQRLKLYEQKKPYREADKQQTVSPPTNATSNPILPVSTNR